ncbi:MAG: right-handed parallel beta-helix repeat-containing protein [Planctomycetota bacterium]
MTFEPEDSGTASCPITYQAHTSKGAIVSAGRRLTGWKPVTVDGKNLWARDVPEKSDFRELWIDNQRCTRARYPNEGYLRIESVPDAAGKRWQEGQDNFIYTEGDIPQWDAPEQGEVVAMCRWVDSHLPIKKIEPEERRLQFTNRSVWRLDPDDKYYIEGVFEALDRPGEWFLDREQNRLYYMPKEGQRLREIIAFAPRLSQVVRFEGDPESGTYVEHLNFRGLTFSHAEWWFNMSASGRDPRQGAWGFAQASIGVPGAVYGDGVRHCTFRECRFVHLGTYALELARGCQHNQVVNCEMADLAAGGVKIGEGTRREDEKQQTHNITLKGCHLHDGGELFHSAVGVWIGQAYDNRVKSNHIHDFYYSGMSVGWTWGFGESLAGGNVIKDNHVHHIGIHSDGDGPVLNDMGSIYTLGVQPGTVVRGNLFHDSAAVNYGGWGIYFDEGSTKILAENNVVYNTTHGGFHQHYGSHNTVRNNIFAFSDTHQIRLSRIEDRPAFTFEKNIVYYSEGKVLGAGYANKKWPTDKVTLRNNVYWCTDGPVSFTVDGEDRNFQDWQETGQGKGSLVADPKFAAPQARNFRLRNNSPAFDVGFKRITLDVPAAPDWAD